MNTKISFYLSQQLYILYLIKRLVVFYFVLDFDYGTIHIMKRYTLAFLLLGLTGCVSDAPNGADVPVLCTGDCSGVSFSMPNGNDLKLETSHHIIHIMAQPDSDYAYYVWTGDKTYDDAPDITVESGDAYVLTSE